MIAAMFPMLLLSVATIATPGPANMAIMGASARFGMTRVWPFIIGVILGKQFIIWSVGLGLLGVAGSYPTIILVMKVASAAYMLYLAWRIAGMSILHPSGKVEAPGFAAGLIVHPLNPKAWALITFIFSGLVPDMGAVFWTTLLVAITLLIIQSILQPLWGFAGQAIAARLTQRWERLFFIALAILMIASIAMAFFGARNAIL